ncbi:squalene monooxygenase [Cladophialophora yegresii CBS 114405]|uniref:Squalene monooxygenase n=1 Tax=Cladophialophora yegresii CBS 114405 TaxID=1182544 RepID=W9VU11_9EURO|nr:squalene monooxygenase [Cladophialophora yegresii CBS 114405]EXJ59053.1 squalene monooxygenase [Cladophialophora yegresii CBS 114405]
MASDAQDWYSDGSDPEDHTTSDVIVIGAGVLGCTVAVALGRQGRKVTVVERSLKEPDRIVGELLQPGGVMALEKLGMADCLEGIEAVPVRGYEVIYHGERVHIPYEYPDIATGQPEEDAIEPKSKPRPQGRSFHHGRFIQKLRDSARRTPGVTLIEATAKELVHSRHTRDRGRVIGVKTSTAEKDHSYFAPLTIVADGYASKFRKGYAKQDPVAKSRFWGIVMKDVPLPQPEHGHVVVGNGAPILLYQISPNETRILVDVPNDVKPSLGESGGTKAHIRRHVLSSIPESIKPMFERAFEDGGLKSMPNQWLPPTTNKTPGTIMLGDALNMRHPLTGGGMTVAINDAVLIGELLSPQTVPDLSDTEAVLAQMAKFHWQRKNLDSVINILAQALYSLFAADEIDQYLKALQRGCFAYFQFGGNCINGPVGLLAGIIRRPTVLIYHFFLVALLSMWLLVRDSKPWMMPLRALQSFVVFGKACQVIFPFLFSELRS